MLQMLGCMGMQLFCTCSATVRLMRCLVMQALRTGLYRGQMLGLQRMQPLCRDHSHCAVDAIIGDASPAHRLAQKPGVGLYAHAAVLREPQSPCGRCNDC